MLFSNSDLWDSDNKTFVASKPTGINQSNSLDMAESNAVPHIGTAMANFDPGTAVDLNSRFLFMIWCLFLCFRTQKL